MSQAMADAVLNPDAHFGLLLAATVGGGDHFDDEVGAEGERFFVVGRELGEAFGGEPGDVGHSAAEVSGADFGVCADGFAAGGGGPVAYLPADACVAAAAVPTGESHDEERSLFVDFKAEAGVEVEELVEDGVGDAPVGGQADLQVGGWGGGLGRGGGGRGFGGGDHDAGECSGLRVGWL